MTITTENVQPLCALIKNHGHKASWEIDENLDIKIRAVYEDSDGEEHIFWLNPTFRAVKLWLGY